MIKGLERFREHFADRNDQYILIGGTACQIFLEENGLDFRATTDFDVVFCVEVIDLEFIDHFFSFIDDGGYQWFEKKEARDNHFFRFFDPSEDGYPEIIEVFSKKIDAIEGAHKAKLIVGGEVLDSLSALLLEPNYYDFIHARRLEIDGVSLVDAPALILLKAKAWVSNTERLAKGEAVRPVDIEKHRADIYRLALTLLASDRVTLDGELAADMGNFLTKARPISKVEREKWGWPDVEDDYVEAILRRTFLGEN